MTYTKLKEFSVVYTDRSLNHMSDEFVAVMQDVSRVLKTVYNAASAVIVPGSGTFGMEAVARQFANDARVLIIRNGWFSYRWTEIFDMGAITDDVTVLTGQAVADQYQAQYQPPAIEDVVAWIKTNRPGIVFAPHVETSAGMILPDDYLTQIGSACKSVDALFVLDCIASGAAWVDMAASGVDVLITAPQKGWTSTPCCALVAMSARARKAIDTTVSTTYSMDLKKWLSIMETYESGKFIYHTTMATDGIKELRDTMLETEQLGFDRLKQQQYALGQQIHELLESYGYPRVAAEGFRAPGVVVCYTENDAVKDATAFRQIGYQTASGIALKVGEREDYKTFRIGLFGLDKLNNIPATVDSLRQALEQIKQGK
jgi:aspartate aminotransferase-like enzyme